MFGKKSQGQLKYFQIQPVKKKDAKAIFEKFKIKLENDQVASIIDILNEQEQMLPIYLVVLVSYLNEIKITNFEEINKK